MNVILLQIQMASISARTCGIFKNILTCILLVGIHALCFPLINSKDVNFEELARCTDDFNGAQLKAVCVEAVSIASSFLIIFLLQKSSTLNEPLHH